jgi:hypothetical protein
MYILKLSILIVTYLTIGMSLWTYMRKCLRPWYRIPKKNIPKHDRNIPEIAIDQFLLHRYTEYL